MNDQQLDDLFDVHGGPVAPSPEFEDDLFGRLEQELIRLEQSEDTALVAVASDAEMSLEDVEVVITPMEREETMTMKPSTLLLLAAAAIVVIAGIFLAIESGSDDSAPVITDEVPGENVSESGSPARTEAFEYSSNGVTTRGKIHLPESFEQGMDLPTIYLIDFTEEGREVALDEFETVIDSVNQLDGVNALVATLEETPDISVFPLTYQEHADLFRDMAKHIDGIYTDNPSRTFIGRGSEAGIVLLELFGEGPEEAAFDNYVATDAESSFAAEVRNILLFGDDFSETATSKKLHLSFSSNTNVQLQTELADLIDQAEYPWLEYESVFHSDLDFENAYPTAFADGLAFVLGPDSGPTSEPSISENLYGVWLTPDNKNHLSFYEDDTWSFAHAEDPVDDFRNRGFGDFTFDGEVLRLFTDPAAKNCSRNSGAFDEEVTGTYTAVITPEGNLELTDVDDLCINRKVEFRGSLSDADALHQTGILVPYSP